MITMIINAENSIVGRIATVAAKKALLGEKVDIINCDKAVITGKKDFILKKFKDKRELGRPTKGPFYFRSPDRFVRRNIRGMLPYKQSKGKEAYKRIMCYVGVPKQFEGKDYVELNHANTDKLPTVKYVTVKDICKSMGAKL